MQTEQRNIRIDRNGKPSYFHDGFWYGPNIVETKNRRIRKLRNGKTIKTENGQYLYEYNSRWYGQDKIFQFDNGFWEEKKRDDKYYIISYKDIGTVSTLIDIHLIDILTEYQTKIKELSKDYKNVILSLKRMITIYGDIQLQYLIKYNNEVDSQVFEFLEYYDSGSGSGRKLNESQLRKKYRRAALSSLIEIIRNEIDRDPFIIQNKIHFKSVVEPKLQDMLYTRIIFFYFQNDNQHDINQQINEYIEIFDRQESRDLIREQCGKIIPYLEYALSHATELNQIQMNESELPETGSDILAYFTEENDFPLSKCLKKADCYIYIGSNTGVFFEGITADKLTAMVYPQDILLKALLSFRTWLFKCTGPPQTNLPSYDTDGVLLDPTFTDGVPNDLKLADDDGNLLIDPVAYAILTINANSSCLVSLSNILSVLYYGNHIMYVVEKPDEIERSVSWDMLYNYNSEDTRVSAKHCQYGSNQKVCELQISPNKIMREAEDIAEQMEEKRQKQLFSHLESYLEDNKKHYELQRLKYELKVLEEEAIELQKIQDEITENEKKDLASIMQDIREDLFAKALELQRARQRIERAKDRDNGFSGIQVVPNGSTRRNRTIREGVPRRPY